MRVVGSLGLLVVLAWTPGAAQVEAGWARVVAVYRQRLADASIAGSSLFLVRDGVVAAKAMEGHQDLREGRERARQPSMRLVTSLVI